MSQKESTTKHNVPVESPTPNQRRLEILRREFPEAFTEGRLDPEKLAAALGEPTASGAERYAFTWAGKRDAVRLLQIPTRATLIPAPEESVNFDQTQNIFIEGDNLEALKLLYKPYFGRVKMIYIDPPYNTGNDFIYPDNFADPLATYLQLTGQQDSEGNLLTTNPETSGRYHSAWLSMMYPRLFLARQLLREDGAIFISIDDHEVHNLRLLMNEIFGEECFMACFIWHRRQMPDSRNQDKTSTDHEYVLCYRKDTAVLLGVNIDLEKYTNPDNDSRGPWFSADLTGLATQERRPNLHYNIIDPETGIAYPPSPTRGWSISKATLQQLVSEKKILWPSKPTGRPRRKKFLSEINNLKTSISTMLDAGFTTEGTREIQDIFGEKVIQFPKPISLMKVLLAQGTQENDIVLDFFAGSSTTAQAVLELNREDGGNRKFILVQLPEPTGNPEFPTIAEIGKERIRRVIRRMEQEAAGEQPELPLEEAPPQDLGFRVYKLAPSNFQPWVGVAERDANAYADQMALFNDPLVEGWREAAVLAELALKHGLSLTFQDELTEVEGLSVHCLNDPESGLSLTVTLAESVPLAAFHALNLPEEATFICRDTALDDETAANIALHCRLETI